MTDAAKTPLAACLNRSRLLDADPPGRQLVSNAHVFWAKPMARRGKQVDAVEVFAKANGDGIVEEFCNAGAGPESPCWIGSPATASAP